MDILCRTCGEPWDNDSLHDRVTELREEGASNATNYGTVSADFRARGCRALGVNCTPGNVAHPGVDAIYELLGDDMDGAAAMLEDMAYLGLLD